MMKDDIIIQAIEKKIDTLKLQQKQYSQNSNFQLWSDGKINGLIGIKNFILNGSEL